MIYSMSVRNPWAFLIAKGYKKIENRHKGICETKLNEPIAVHVANKQYPKQERHKYYQLEIVQECLKMDNDTKLIHNDNNKLDSFFSDISGSIIAIIYITKTIKSKENKNVKQYKFANIPKEDMYHWIISKSILLSSPIANYSGCLGVRQIKNENVVKIIKEFLNEQSRGNKEEQIEKLKKEHLFIPENVLKNQVQLIRYDYNGNCIRWIYDSEDELDDDETESEDEDKENNNLLSNKPQTNPIRNLLNKLHEKCEKDKWTTSYDGKYWIKK